MLWVALLGLFASTYLLITYVSGTPIVCGLVSGCEAVRASSWSYTFGIPRPALGVAFYLAIIGLLIYRVYAPHHLRRWSNVSWLLTFVGFIESGFLTLVQWIDIKAFCIWCLVSAVASTVLFVLSFFDAEDRLDTRMAFRELKTILFSFIVAMIAGGLGLYLLLAAPLRGEKIIENVVAKDPQAAGLILPTTPVEGPVSSTVTIIEFLDFECPGCAAFHPVMQRIRQEFAGRIRYAQRLFPLVETHPHAKGAAIAAVCAQRQNQYYPYADALIVNRDHLTRDDLIHYAEALRLDRAAFVTCLDDPTAAEVVIAERKAGEALGIDSTPTIFLNDAVFEGIPSYEQLRTLIEQGLK